MRLEGNWHSFNASITTYSPVTWPRESGFISVQHSGRTMEKRSSLYTTLKMDTSLTSRYPFFRTYEFHYDLTIYFLIYSDLGPLSNQPFLWFKSWIVHWREISSHKSPSRKGHESWLALGSIVYQLCKCSFQAGGTFLEPPGNFLFFLSREIL